MAGVVTLSEVAREAGVSLATASRALNGSPNRTVRPHLRDRVLEAAERLRYSPDANAQAMARGRTTLLGLIVNDIADPYFSSIAAGVMRAADGAGLAVTLASTPHDPTRESRFVDLLTRQRAQAIVVAGGRRDDDAVNAEMRHALEGFCRLGGAAALISQPLLGVDTVVVDNRDGAGRLARALHERGVPPLRRAVRTGQPPHREGSSRGVLLGARGSRLLLRPSGDGGVGLHA